MSLENEIKKLRETLDGLAAVIADGVSPVPVQAAPVAETTPEVVEEAPKKKAAAKKKAPAKVEEVAEAEDDLDDLIGGDDAEDDVDTSDENMARLVRTLAADESGEGLLAAKAALKASGAKRATEIEGEEARAKFVKTLEKALAK